MCALSFLLDRFEKEDQLFAAQCIWWLANIIQFTEILSYDRHYKVFPSNYVANLLVTPLQQDTAEKDLVKESNIPLLNLDNYSTISENTTDIAVHPTRSKLLPEDQINRSVIIYTTRSGKIPKNWKRNYLNKELESSFSPKTTRQRSILGSLLMSGKLEYWLRLRWDLMLPMVSEHQIYQGSWMRVL